MIQIYKIIVMHAMKNGMPCIYNAEMFHSTFSGEKESILVRDWCVMVSPVVQLKTNIVFSTQQDVISFLRNRLDLYVN